MNVLFICNGNICRSPLAESLLIKKYEESGIKASVSSAGFESFNINEPPHPQALEIAKKNHLKLDHSARLFLKSDFNIFDKIYVMDTHTYRDVAFLARNINDKNKIEYLMNVLEPGKNKTIPDPFQSGKIDVESVFKILDQATDKIVEIAKSN